MTVPHGITKAGTGTGIIHKAPARGRFAFVYKDKESPKTWLVNGPYYQITFKIQNVVFLQYQTTFEVKNFVFQFKS